MTSLRPEWPEKFRFRSLHQSLADSIFLSANASACFVTQLSNALAPSWATPDVEAGVTSLAGEGLVLVQHHYCRDPHLTNEDFRVFVRIDPSTHDQAESEAVVAAQRVWQAWRPDYLASRRCT